MVKQQYRTAYLQKRLALSKSEFWQLNDLIVAQLNNFNWSAFNYVHLFLPINGKNEVDTFEILSFFKSKFPDLNIVVPRTNFKDSSMEHILFDHEHTILIKNSYQIPEPLYGKTVPINLIDAVFIPLLTFDEKGHRIGYGGGFYDRFLKTCNTNTLKIGLSLFGPEKEILDINEFDIPLNHCITPEKVYTFNSL
ncbi:MAG: 5-formyltetrahydrofolate cyclo-ligase [Pelobium sp.]